MTIFGALLEKRAQVAYDGEHPEHFISWLSGDRSFSGVEVSETNALTYTAVYGAVRILSESVASLPLKLYRRRSDGGKDEASDHPTYALVHDMPNPETTSFIFRETLQGHLCTWGNAYAEIQRRANGQPAGLWQRRPDRVEIERVSGALQYQITRTDGPEDFLPADRVLHVPGLSFNGFTGFSPIRMARESIGAGLAQERSAASFFGNASMPGGFIKHPQSLNEQAQERIRNTLEKIHKGPGNAHRLAVLDEGMDWVQAGIPNEDSQFLESRVFQVQEVCRWFRIPPHMLAELSHATFTNIEHQDLEFVKYTLMPWLRRWEAEMNRKLLTMQEQSQGYFFEFLVDGLLRGDIKTRYESYSVAIKDGWMSRNEVRSKENMNPEDGLDQFILPQQTLTVGDDVAMEDGESAQETEEPRSESRAFNREQRSLDARWQLREVFRELLEQAASRLVASEVRAIRAKINMIPNEGDASFRRWLESFFEKHRDFAVTVMGPVLRAYIEAVSSETVFEVDGDPEGFASDVLAFADEYIEAFGLRHVSIGENEILSALRSANTDEQVIAALDSTLGGWEESRARKIAMSESTRAGAAISTMIYAAAGVTLLKWRANANACPLCRKLNGRTVEIRQPFLNKGDQVDAGDGIAPIKIKQAMRHPPLHGGCACSISPA